MTRDGQDDAQPGTYAEDRAASHHLDGHDRRRVTVADLRRFADAFAGLGDEELMSRAWN
jgi:hypothetical protein